MLHNKDKIATKLRHHQAFYINIQTHLYTYICMSQTFVKNFVVTAMTAHKKEQQKSLAKVCATIFYSVAFSVAAFFFCCYFSVTCCWCCYWCRCRCRCQLVSIGVSLLNVNVSKFFRLLSRCCH